MIILGPEEQQKHLGFVVGLRTLKAWQAALVRQLAQEPLRCGCVLPGVSVELVASERRGGLLICVQGMWVDDNVQDIVWYATRNSLPVQSPDVPRNFFIVWSSCKLESFSPTNCRNQEEYRATD